MVVVLVVLVAMMLGGLSVLRGVDTSSILSGNLAFKRDSINQTGSGIATALRIMQTADFRAKGDTDTGCPANCGDAAVWKKMNYSPRLLESDANGIPVVLKSSGTFDSVFTADKPAAAPGNTVRVLIERMCNGYGLVTETKCALAANFERGGSQPQDKPGAAALPLYRVTVRTDGPRNTQTYAQAIVTVKSD
ncbi:hypothetical protein OPU71_02900 [Niveibacterium sp. 24ML]|uniref:hypothetical protein n=1 Tax=Niveibacterium sp. 24ML TaxID=2985512 RepID=UPI00226F8E52|nr:hypothetical protein [Niveibacterium sp. 24ML]MCX9155068.1 hypothetical protein [Niveibacterium sp. 24ML]